MFHTRRIDKSYHNTSFPFHVLCVVSCLLAICNFRNTRKTTTINASGAGRTFTKSRIAISHYVPKDVIEIERIIGVLNG